MKRFQKFIYSLHPLLLSSIASVLTVAQIVLAFFLHGYESESLKWAGSAFGFRESLAYCQLSHSAQRVVYLREKAI